MPNETPEGLGRAGEEECFVRRINRSVRVFVTPLRGAVLERIVLDLSEEVEEAGYMGDRVRDTGPGLRLLEQK